MWKGKNMRKDEKKSSRCSDNFSEIFAERLRKARDHKKITQEEIAEKLNISSRTYQHYEAFSESNVRVPNLEIVQKLSKILDCDITYLTGENNENEFRKDISNAASITGLDYETIEILEKSKDIAKSQEGDKKYFNKIIIFVINFLVKNIRCRQLVYYLFFYWFKDYNNVVFDNGGGSNTIVLEDKSLIEDRNLSIYVSDISENVFYSWIMQAITRIKDSEDTQNIDTSSCDYVPTKESIEDEIKTIDEQIEHKKHNNYKEYNPYTPEYALKIRHYEDTNIWADFPNLAEKVTERVRFDICNEKIITDLIDRKEYLIEKKNKLYPVNKKNDK